LEAAQKAMGDVLCKLVLSKSGQSDLTYGVDTTNRLLDLKFSFESYRQSAEVIVDNRDGNLTDLDLRGYKGVISLGYKTSAGDEYKPKPPLWTLGQKADTILLPNGDLLTSFALAGLSNLLNEDEANDDYTPDSNNSDTVKTILTAIAEASLSVYDHCHAYTITFDSEDSLLDSYIPKDSLRIYLGDSRLTIMRRLLRYTLCDMRIEDDGEIHIRQVESAAAPDWAASTAYALRDTVKPTTDNTHIYVCTTAGTSGGSEPTFGTTIDGTTNDNTVVWTLQYDYQYNDVATGHNFYDKSTRRRAVVPGYFEVESHPSHTSDTIYTGNAQDEYYSTLPTEMQIRKHKRLRVTSNAQCTSIAEALLQHQQLDAEVGHGNVPMNCGQEVLDLVKITDSIASDYRIGNVLYIKGHYRPSKFDMQIRFGSVELGGSVGTLPPFLSNPQQVTQLISLDPQSLLELRAGLQDLIDTLNDITIPTINANFEEIKKEVKEIEPLPDESPPTDITWIKLFDGSSDPTPSTVAWANETGLPFTFTGAVYFSPIIEEVPNVKVVYVIDRSATEFWEYNITTKEWTQLASPTYSGENVYRTLAINPLGTKLACISEGGASEPVGRRIEIYDIGTDTWSASAQSPTIVSAAGGLKSIVWEDNDTIWAWARDGTNLRGKCIKYVPSTDTWTTYSANTGTKDGWQGRCAAIKGTTVVYGGLIADNPNQARKYQKYTIATDTYSEVDTSSSGANFAWAYDKDKLWFVDTTDYRQGYVDTSDDSVNADQFAENTERSSGHGIFFGVGDDLADIIAHAKNSTPELMSVLSGGTYLLGTIYASGFQWVWIEKPDDNYPVTVVNTSTNKTQSYDDTSLFIIQDGTYKVYYPVNGDVTQILVKYARF
jgi:hypothetical protein